MTITEAGMRAFKDRFGIRPEATYFSPGRVNLIGEHTDYNGGWVLPAAIDLGNYFFVSRNKHNDIRIYSETFTEGVSISVSDVGSIKPHNHWRDYFVGVMKEFSRISDTTEGLDILVKTNLPTRGGLSSSASITTGFAAVLNNYWSIGFNREHLASIAQNAENNHVGVACGILDPFSIAMGKERHVIALNCLNMEWQHVPFVGGYRIVVANTAVPRQLVDSNYNQRRRECERAIWLAGNGRGVQSLSEFSLVDIQNCEQLVADDIAFRRSRHIVTENERVLLAISALKNDCMLEFGQQLIASHNSLRDDYEVSCRELNIMVDEALQLHGIVGAKMTGAGFGGCVVAVVEEDAVDDFVAKLDEKYSSKCSQNGTFFSCIPSSGVARLRL